MATTTLFKNLWVSIFIIIMFSSVRVLSRPVSFVFDVTHYGATGDGYSDDTSAFVKAWEATCKSSSSSSAAMVVPSGMTFLVHPLYFEGPCKPDHVNVEINGDIVAPQDPSLWKCKDSNCNKWIHFRSVNGLSVYGFGKIHGRGEKWWDQHGTKPTAFQISNSNNVQISGLTFKNNPRMHLVLYQIRTLQVSNITIDAPGNSPNTDGIHISGCTDVSVDHCNIATGDDCISIVSGSSNIKISKIICGPGHGISIGSLGKHGANDKVEHVHVRDSVFRGSSNGARIKTWQESAVKVSNVTFREIVGAPRKEAGIIINCSATMACTDIVLDNIDLRLKEGTQASYQINNAYGRIQGQVIPHIPLLN
ncbi:hypothetical protein LguiA_028192 [Lonicera macranthoides]